MIMSLLCDVITSGYPTLPGIAPQIPLPGRRMNLATLAVGMAVCLSPTAHTYLPLIDGNPVGGRKPFVVFDVVDTIFQVAIAFGEIHLE